jgi:hypothetical protein
VKGESAFDSINLAPTAVHEIVIIGHGLAERFVRHELLLGYEEVIDPLDLRLSHDCPERLTRDIGEQTKRLLSDFFEHVRDGFEFRNHRSDVSRFAMQDLTNDVHGALLSHLVHAWN